MELLTVPANFIDRAWQDGAHTLSAACEASGGEVTIDQLKLMLARGERTLIQMRSEDKIVGWGVIRIDQLPNIRVLHITDLVAPNQHFESFFSSIQTIARDSGCSRVRCGAPPAQARLYASKCGFKPVYSILEVVL